MGGRGSRGLPDAVVTSGHVKPEIHILGISLKAFGIVFACGFVAAGAILMRRLRELGKPQSTTRTRWRSPPSSAAWSARGCTSWSQNYSQVKHDLLGQPVLRLGARLVRRRDRRGDRRDRLGRMAGDPRPRPARPGQPPAGDGLCDRSDRLSGGRRRRLRQGPRTCRGRCHIRTGRCRPRRASRSSRPRSTRRWRWASSPGGCGGCATASGPARCSPSTSCCPGLERLLVEFVRRNHHVVAGLTAPQLESIALMIVGGGLAGAALAQRRGAASERAARAWRPREAVSDV